MLSHDIVFPCRDSALLLCRDRGFHVATEKATTRGQVLHPSCCNRFGLGKVFSVATEHFRSRQSLVRAKSFYVVTKYFCVSIEFDLGWGFYVSIEFKLQLSYIQNITCKI